MTLKQIALAVAILAGIIPVRLFAGAEDSIALKYSQTITAENIKKFVSTLASEKFEGRETAQKGQKLAADYIAAHFSGAGLTPLTGNSYFQKIPLERTYPGGVKITTEKDTFLFMQDFLLYGNSKDTTLRLNNFLFLGYGIEDSSYNDIRGKEIKGRDVVVYSGEPYDKRGNSFITKDKTPSDWTTNRRKKQSVWKKYKPARVFVVTENFEGMRQMANKSSGNPSLHLEGRVKETNNQPETFYLSPAMAEKLFSNGKNTLSELKKKISENKDPGLFEWQNNITVEIKNKTEKTSSENVVGFIEGSDLKDQVIVVSAHYDHLGKKDSLIYFGADDNASGTSAVMALADAMALARKDGRGPRRSVLFLSFTGEEKGLLGSDYFVANPVIPLSKIVADMNTDMIGRTDDAHKDSAEYVYIIGAGKVSTTLHRATENANTLYTHLRLDDKYNTPDDPNRFYYRSDHYNFAKYNIPIIMYFTGIHADYHKPSDTADKIEFEKMQKIIRLMFFTLWDLANTNEKIEMDVKGYFDNNGR